MRPFSDLPPRVMASLLAVPAVLALAGLAWPWATVLALLCAAGITAAGGMAVAAEAARARQGRASGATLMAATAAGLATAGLALWFAAPGLTVKDAGELASSALVLGVAHPTGFPAFCLSGRLAGYLPAGSALFRVNLLSALSLGLAAGAAVALAREASRSAGGGASSTLPWAAAIAAVALVASPTTWLHGTTTEVYMPSAAGLAGALACAVAGVRRSDARWLVAGAALAGLGLGGHVTWPLYAGWGVGVAGLAFVRRTGAWRLLPVMAGAALLAALVTLYLPVAAGRDPVMDWGHPAGWQGWWDHVSGGRIRRSFAGQLGGMGPAVLAVNAREALRTFAEGTVALWPFALAGLALAGGPQRVAAVALGGVVVLDGLFAVRVNPMGLRDLQVLVPATLATGVLAAMGAEALAGVLSRRGRPVAAALVVALALAAAVAQGVLAPSDRDLRDVHAPREVAGTMLAGLPPGASVLTVTDDLSATVAALQAVEGARPDVLWLVKQHLGDTRAVARALAARGGRPGEEGLREALDRHPFEAGGEAPAAALARAVDLLGRRGAVRVETGESAVDAGLMERLAPGFPASPVGAVDDAEALERAREVAREVDRHGASSDRWARGFLAAQARGTATLLARRGLDRPALSLLALALRLDPSDARSMHNLAVLLADAGDRPEAVRWLRRAVAEEPGYARGWRTLARVAAEAGDPALATEAGERAAELSAP